ncbi:MAG: ABC transporter ATP-binding protein [Oscillospiraceae bacterium]|nr:ABC transporter ATP-binding protein [Oscillospiraceae bacterium]
MKSRDTLRWLCRSVKKRIGALILMTLSSAGGAYLSVRFALGTRSVIDSAVSGDRDAFFRAASALAAVIAGIIVLRMLQRHLHDNTEAKLDRDWKRRLLHLVLHGEYRAVSSYHSGELINRLNNDVRIVDDGLISVLPNLASMVTRLAAAVWVLASMEPLFTLLLAAGGAAVVLITSLLRRLIKSLHKRVQEADGRLSSFLQETIEKLLLVQAMDVSEEAERRADRLLEARFAVQRRRKNIGLGANTCVNILCFAAEFAALVWCAFRLLHGSITFGTFTAIVQLVGQLEGPVVNVSGIIPKYIAMLASAERLMELDALSRPVVPSADPAALYADMTALCAEDLSFSYEDEELLSHVSFSIPKGSFVAVTGLSGIGKSTLLKLMLGIYAPTSGTLTAAGPDVPLDRATRRLFAYVPQGNLLFSGTLRDNLLITRPDATEDEIVHALHVSALDDVVAQLPQGLETVLGENAAGLSEGQAQRLSIARAILSGAPVLMLDEVTSALDAATERTVLERIAAMPGCTCIAVTHRPAALEMAHYNLCFSDTGINLLPGPVARG